MDTATSTAAAGSLSPAHLQDTYAPAPAGSLGEEERADIRRMLARRAQLEKDGYVAAVASYSEGTSARSAENIELVRAGATQRRGSTPGTS